MTANSLQVNIAYLLKFVDPKRGSINRIFRISSDFLEGLMNSNCRFHCRHRQLKKANINPLVFSADIFFEEWWMSANLV